MGAEGRIKQEQLKEQQCVKRWAERVASPTVRCVLLHTEKYTGYVNTVKITQILLISSVVYISTC